MTLIDAILKNVKTKDANNRKYTSPPPEIAETVLVKKSKRRKYKYRYIKVVVDSSPPPYDAQRSLRSLPEWGQRAKEIYWGNARMLYAITTAYMNGGKVDTRWNRIPRPSKQYYETRMHSYKNIMRENIDIFKRISNTGSRVIPTKCLQRDWERNKIEMMQMANSKFILFPITPVDMMEDPAFAPPENFKRPRVCIKLRAHGGSSLGWLRVELFTDVCPRTCGLFLELMRGDGVGHGYVGTRFFSKVPHLFWAGGDVTYDTGVGCYAQRGLPAPISAENYHFSHSMPGLLSMQVTRDEETCGMFNITFKPIPHFDLKNVVFGRIIRPCTTFEVVQTLPGCPHPVVEIESAKLKVNDRWVYGTRNTRIRSVRPVHVPRPNK